MQLDYVFNEINLLDILFTFNREKIVSIKDSTVNIENFYFYQTPTNFHSITSCGQYIISYVKIGVAARDKKFNQYTIYLHSNNFDLNDIEFDVLTCGSYHEHSIENMKSFIYNNLLFICFKGFTFINNTLTSHTCQVEHPNFESPTLPSKNILRLKCSSSFQYLIISCDDFISNNFNSKLEGTNENLIYIHRGEEILTLLNVEHKFHSNYLWWIEDNKILRIDTTIGDNIELVYAPPNDTKGWLNEIYNSFHYGDYYIYIDDEVASYFDLGCNLVHQYKHKIIGIVEILPQSLSILIRSINNMYHIFDVHVKKIIHKFINDADQVLLVSF
jgi:hypothetical protein